MRVYCCLLIATLVAASHALYGPNTDVVELTANNFNNRVLDSDEVWLVEFYAPWCGHCKALAPEWSKAATALKGIVKVGAVDMDVHQSVGGPYNIRGFPTIKIFGGNKNSPQDYNGQRTAQGIVNSALDAVRSAVNDRLSGRGGGRRSGGSGRSQGGNKEDVVELTDGNFEREVLNSKDLWLVEFFAPWCGHCQRLAPEWAKAATELKGKVKLGAVDATVHTVLASRYQIQGYPSIKVFAAGVKDSHSVEDYNGGRTASDIVQYALDRHAESIDPPELLQVISSDVLKAECNEKPICVVSILPHILDTGAEGRNNYLNILKELGEKYKKKQWGWIWAEANAQPKLEKALGMGGFGYPALAAANTRKKVYVSLRGSFDKTGIDELLRALAVGRGSTRPIEGAALPEVDTTEPWDGKDGQLPVEEDIDLSDVSLDDDDEDDKKKEEL